MENEITQDNIKAIRAKLKRLSIEWADDLGKKMDSDFPGMNATKVYNVVNGLLKHQQYRRSFVLHAEKLMSEYESKQKKVAGKVEQLLEKQIV